MEDNIKLLLFLAFLLISVISSVVKGLRKFNQNRPGTAQPRQPEPAREYRRSEETGEEVEEDPFREIIRELEESFGKSPEEKQNVPPPVFGEKRYSSPQSPEPYYTREAEGREAKSLETNIPGKADEAFFRSEKLKSPTAERATHRTQITSLHPDEPAFEPVGLPSSSDDLRKMVIWSAILNRPQF